MENLLLTQQLLVASRQVKQPKLRPWERCPLVVLESRFGHWREATLLARTLFPAGTERDFVCCGDGSRDGVTDG